MKKFLITLIVFSVLFPAFASPQKLYAQDVIDWEKKIKDTQDEKERTLLKLQQEIDKLRGKSVSEKQQIEREVSDIFKTIIDLWYEGKYDSLY